METEITSCYYWMEIHLLLSLLLRNSTYYNRAKSSMYKNHGNDETNIQKVEISLGKQNCLARTVRFLCRNQHVLSLRHIITIGKISTGKNLNKN